MPDFFGFSVKQSLFQRTNPDNSRITPTRVLGFSGTIDVSTLGASQDVTFKLDDGSEDTQTVSLAAIVDSSAATVAELVTAFTAAGFTDITFSTDSGTSRFAAAYSGAGSPTYIQMYDDGTDTLCQVMDIGQGLGAKIIVKDNLLSASATANRKDKEEIETEDGNGQVTSVTFAAELKGFDPSLSLQIDDPELKELLFGGTYDATEVSYAYPSQNDEPPTVTLEVFQDLYNEGTNKKPDFVRVRRSVYYSGEAVPGDDTADAKAWSPVNVDFSFLDYSDPTASNAKIGPKKDYYMAKAAFQAIDWTAI